MIIFFSYHISILYENDRIDDSKSCSSCMYILTNHTFNIVACFLSSMFYAQKL